MGNNSSLYLQNYTLNLIATDLHGHACIKKCNSEACPTPPSCPAASPGPPSSCPAQPSNPAPSPKPPSCPAPSPGPPSSSSEGPIYRMEETNLDNNSPCPATEFELCPTPTPSPTPTPTPETTPTSEYTIPVPTPPTQSELERIIQLANNASIINSMKTDPIVIKKFLEMQYGITDNQFCYYKT